MRSIVVLFLFIALSSGAQNLVSPSTFLGYELGEKFTPYHSIMDYYRHAASAAPQRMQLKEYGTTYEGRKLVYAVVSSPENISRIEAIRQNNLRLSGNVSGQAAQTDMPAVVWLSYNVHGNEASSSEVAMEMLYRLVSGSEPAYEQWLRNVVVIIDPCLNPDGRDRYVNWYNQTVGRVPNASPGVREHDEPWPRGRTNHYYFDLNRDWAWQTQTETRQRMKVYHEWMPVVHVDFHEQFVDNPYYFAPAAEPFHEAITPFQRSFQSVIGKNHARYFDREGWLYFTREYFDLFYPAYGDTYPIFNGAIGMTYEQAGHSRAGLTIKTETDTLTLYDRIAHHLTTGLSTIEVASQNYTKLNEAFKQYFDDASSKGSGAYKTYILDGSDPGKVQSITELLRLNRIQYGYAAKAQKVKGFSYFTGKTEDQSVKEGDIIVPVEQSKATLIRVLFEPHSRLSDSLTYDITAWALPYAYGMQGIATTAKLGYQEQITDASKQQLNDQAYAFLVDYSSFREGKFLTLLLKEGIRLRVSEQPFVYRSKTFHAGTIVILKNGNEAFLERVGALADSMNIALWEAESGFMDSGVDFGSDKVKPVKRNRVGIVAGEKVYDGNVGSIWHLFDQQLQYPLSVFKVTELDNLPLNELDVLILPEGYYGNLDKKDENDALKNWVRKGGKIIAIGETAAQMASGDWGIDMKKAAKENASTDIYQNVKKYAERERNSITNHIPGAIYRLELDNTHPLAFGYPDHYYTLKTSGHLFSFMKNAWNVGVMKKDKQVAGFVGSKMVDKIQDGSTIVVQPYGSGTIVYLADDPLFRGFWENGKLLFVNAVFLAGF